LFKTFTFVKSLQKKFRMFQKNLFYSKHSILFEILPGSSLIFSECLGHFILFETFNSVPNFTKKFFNLFRLFKTFYFVSIN